MVWTYNSGEIGTSTLFQVRRLIGDVVFSDQQIADEEISFALTQRSSIYGAAAECCRYLAAQYGRLVDQTTAGAGGSLHQGYSQRARAYATMATGFEAKSAMSGGAMPYAGGISVSDKQAQEQNTDRVSPQFNLGMEDNMLPVASVGNVVDPDLSGQGDS